MRSFIESHNIDNFKDQLKTEIDPVKRVTLMALLAEEEAKHALTAGRIAQPPSI